MIETIPAALAGERVDRAVAMLTDLPRSEVGRLVDEGRVFLNDGVVASKARRIAEGDILRVEVVPSPPAVLAAERGVVFVVVHEDADVVVIDKPAGLVVHPGAGNQTGTLVHGLLARYPELAGVGAPDRPGIVHRLDAGTSGLLVVARRPAAYESLVAQLQARTVERRYLTLVVGTVEAQAGVVDAPIGRSGSDPTRMAVSARGREARTRYDVQERFLEPFAATSLECRLETGRTHQIRVHLNAIGHPVLGDARYGGGRAGVDLDRPFLHAHSLSFDHPGTGLRASFTSALPPDLGHIRAAFT
jgi:23S rRNA pseudouridine1911/1915/1917 synthase